MELRILRIAETPSRSESLVDTDRGVTPRSDFPPPVASRLLVSQVLAAVLLVPALPIIGLLVLLVRWTSPGPGIYRQRRVGYQGREFVMFKIRSMRQDAEAATGPVWAIKNDTRTTRLGRFLRSSHLDELPQLWNVLRGEMCLIGPRPERPEIIEKLEPQLSRYRERLEVPPGLSGLAQLRQDPDSDIESARSKLALDLAYIQQLASGRWIDARICLATFFVVTGLSRERATNLFRLDTIEPLPIEVEPTEVEAEPVEETYRRAA